MVRDVSSLLTSVTRCRRITMVLEDACRRLD
jgi:hypothetical protein